MDTRILFHLTQISNSLYAIVDILLDIEEEEECTISKKSEQEQTKNSPCSLKKQTLQQDEKEEN